MRRGAALPALALIVLAAGCGVKDPYAQRTSAAHSRAGAAATAPSPPPTPPTDAIAPHGRLAPAPASGQLRGEGPPSARAREPRSFPTAATRPAATLALAARLYGNWTSANAAARFRQIVAISVGDARAQLRQIAAQAGNDPQQTAGGVRSQATVEAVVVRGSGAVRSAIVVTRQLLSGDRVGTEGARYQVTLATVGRRGAKWVISRWTPQP